MCEFDAVFAFVPINKMIEKTTKPYDYSKRLRFFNLSKKGF
ncbi:hypothetical protein ckin5_00210 [Helicobacter pylori]